MEFGTSQFVTGGPTTGRGIGRRNINLMKKSKYTIETIRDKNGVVFVRASDIIRFLKKVGQQEAANILEYLKINDETEDK